MKKVLTVVICAAICVAIGSVDIQAGKGCAASKDGKDTKAAGCAGHSKAACDGSQLGAACGVLGKYCTPEECAKWAETCKKYDGKCETVALTVKGMTCGGCESSVSGALSEIEGVIDVFKVSHQAGAAVVCYDPAKLTDKSLLTSAVTKKGFKAELFVANTTTQSKKAATCAKTCTPAQQKACGVKTADASKEKDSGTK